MNKLILATALMFGALTANSQEMNNPNTNNSLAQAEALSMTAE